MFRLSAVALSAVDKALIAIEDDSIPDIAALQPLTANLSWITQELHTIPANALSRYICAYVQESTSDVSALSQAIEAVFITWAAYAGDSEDQLSLMLLLELFGLASRLREATCRVASLESQCSALLMQIAELKVLDGPNILEKLTTVQAKVATLRDQCQCVFDSTMAPLMPYTTASAHLNSGSLAGHKHPALLAGRGGAESNDDRGNRPSKWQASNAEAQQVHQPIALSAYWTWQEM
jgi:hypothetical protein